MARRAKPDSSNFLLRGVSLHKATHRLPKNVKKKVKKEVNKVIGTYEPELKRVINTRNTKKSFFKMRAVDIKKGVVAKKQKHASRKSHHTTPGEVLGQDAAPRNVHMEGKRWIKTIEKQQKDRSKKLFKHLGKKSYSSR